MRTRENAHEPEVLGNISAVERPGEELVEKEGTGPRPARRECRVLAVRVSFEANRLAASYLATAYEQVLPLRRRSHTAAARAREQVERPRVRRAGA